LTAVTVKHAHPIAASLNGAGALSAVRAVRMLVDVDLAGRGRLRANAWDAAGGPHFGADFQGAGTLTALAHAVTSRPATLAGAGVLSVTASVKAPSAATLSGRGVLSALMTMIPVFDSASNNVAGFGSTSLTISHTATAGAYAIVDIGSDQAIGLTGVTYDGKTMAKIASAWSSGPTMERYAVANVPSGAKNVVASWSGGAGPFVAGSCETYLNVGAVQSAQTSFTPAGSATVHSDTVTCPNTTLAVEVVGGVAGAGSFVGLTMTGGTNRYNVSNNNSSMVVNDARGTTTFTATNGLTSGPIDWVTISNVLVGGKPKTPFSGHGALSALVAQGFLNPAFPGHGVLSATMVKIAHSAAALSGHGALTAIVAKKLGAFFHGQGVLTARANPAAKPTFAGAGVLSAPAHQFAAAGFAGAGVLSATGRLYSLHESAAFAGAGVLSATAIPRANVAAGFTGSGALSAVTSQAGHVSCAFAGAGVLSATAIQRFPRSAALAGAGVLSATAAEHYVRSATLAGAGVLSATRYEKYARSAALAGAGVLSATATKVVTNPSIKGTVNIAQAATVTIPTHAVGDLIIIFAYRGSRSATAPTQPSAGGTVPTWTSVDTSTTGINSSRVSRTIAVATNHTSGTFTNASTMMAIVISGANATTPVGGHSVTDNAGGQNMATTSITMSDTSGASLILNLFAGGDSINTFTSTWGSAPSGYTLVNSAVASNRGICLNTKNSSTSDGAATQTTGNSGGTWGCIHNIEILKV
jgi:hypothetical protein